MNHLLADGPHNHGTHSMLHDFLLENREAVIARCRQKAAQRLPSSGTADPGDHGVPLFLQQLIDVLRQEAQSPGPTGFDPPAAPASTEIGRAAALQGAQSLRLGFSIDQVVHSYGDICQSITELAIDQNARISSEDFRTLNRCLDDAIADAVASFGRTRQITMDEETQHARRSANAFMTEHFRLVEIAIEAFAAINTGAVGPTGATAGRLHETLLELRQLVPE